MQDLAKMRGAGSRTAPPLTSNRRLERSPRAYSIGCPFVFPCALPSDNSPSLGNETRVRSESDLWRVAKRLIVSAHKP
jgi:hypothetical protein